MTADGDNSEMQTELTYQAPDNRGGMVYVFDPTQSAPTDELLAEKTRNRILNKVGGDWGKLETVTVGETVKPMVKTTDGQGASTQFTFQLSPPRRL